MSKTAPWTTEKHAESFIFSDAGGVTAADWQAKYKAEADEYQDRELRRHRATASFVYGMPLLVNASRNSTTTRRTS